MNEPALEVRPDQVFAILGAKEVELQLLRAQCAAQAAKIKELEGKLAPPAPPPPPVVE